MPFHAFLEAFAIRGPLMVWYYYVEQLAVHPVGTKALTSFLSAAAGDALAQRLTRGAKPASRWLYDWARTLRLAVFNGALMGPLGHYYYNILDASVLPHDPTSPPAVITKLLIDQMLWAPTCTFIFYVYKCFVECRPRDCAMEVRQKWVLTTTASWKLWVPAHIFNFAFVPTEQRILYANLVSVAGTYILSRCAAGEPPSRKSSNVQPLTGPATLQDGAASAGAPQAKRPVRSSAQPRQTVKSIEVLLDTVVTEMKTE